MGGPSLTGRPPERTRTCRLLVYHAGALGDFITALPAVRAWRGGEACALMGRPPYAALADPAFTAVWDAGGAAFSSLFSSAPGAHACRLGPLLAEVRSALLFSPASSPLAANLRALGVRDILRQDPFPVERLHVVDYHLALVGGVGDSIPRVATARGPLPVPADGRTAVIAPGSGSVAKNWPRERFLALAARLESHGRSVAWALGPAEAEMPLHAGSLLWKDLPLPVLGAALSRCGLYVGNDSGVTHLAAAVGCATVALFGVSDPALWAPRGRSVRLVRSPGSSMNDLDVEDVWAACRNVLA